MGSTEAMKLQIIIITPSQCHVLTCKSILFSSKFCNSEKRLGSSGSNVLGVYSATRGRTTPFASSMLLCISAISNLGKAKDKNVWIHKKFLINGYVLVFINCSYKTPKLFPIFLLNEKFLPTIQAPSLYIKCTKAHMPAHIHFFKIHTKVCMHAYADASLKGINLCKII